jgi:hypothetical protein
MLRYRIERIDTALNRVEVHLHWFVPMGKGIRTVSDTVFLYSDNGEPVSEGKLTEAIKERAETHIKPTYVNPPVKVDETVANMVGTEGEI